MTQEKDKLIGLPKDIQEYHEQIKGIQELATNINFIGESQEYTDNPSPYFKRRIFIDKNLKITRITEEHEALQETYDSLGIILVIDSSIGNVGQYYNPLTNIIYDEPPVIDYDSVVKVRRRQRMDQDAFDSLKQKYNDLEKKESTLRAALGSDNIDEQINELFRQIGYLKESVSVLATRTLPMVWQRDNGVK